MAISSLTYISSFSVNFSFSDLYQLCKFRHPLKLLYQFKPNFTGMVLSWSPLKIMSDSPTLHSRWQPLMNIEIYFIVYCCFIISQNELKFKLHLHMIEWGKMSNIFICVVGFSLKSWMTERHFVPGSKLPEYAILQLVKDLGVAGYLKKTPCDKTSSLYTPAVHRWKQGQHFHFFH
jgi:hypothetical protein